MDKYLIISADGHAGPPAAHYRQYLDPAFREEFDEHHRQVDANRKAQREQSVSKDFLDEWGGEGDLAFEAAYDSDKRNAVLDREGVAAEVLFPDADVLGTSDAASSPFGSGLTSSGDSDPVKVMAGARAHNRWLADFVKASPDRRVGLAVVPILHDIEAAVKEIHEAKKLGLRGIVIPTRWMSQPAYNHPRYEPIWHTCAELDMVLHTHSAIGPNDYGEGPGFIGIYTTEVVWFGARPMWVLLWAGVFERHPKLKFVVAENGAFWAPDILARMDARWVGDHATAKFGALFRADLKMKPSEYFKRNVFLAASTPHEIDLERRHAIGVGNMMWGNDLPHPEGTYPHTRKWIHDRFKGLPEAEARRILGENAAQLYGIDVAKLQPIVERIGPTRADVHA